MVFNFVFKGLILFFKWLKEHATVFTAKYLSKSGCKKNKLFIMTVAWLRCEADRQAIIAVAAYGSSGMEFQFISDVR
jgi:hypothetical protein